MQRSKNTEDFERRRVAYHEAGHAVMCYLSRNQIRDISIIADNETQGRMRPVDWSWVTKDYNAGTLPRKDAEAAAILVLGGCAAEARFLGRPKARLPLSGGEQDWEIALQLAGGQCGDDDEFRAYLRWLVCRTRKLVGIYWDMVEAVAERLVQRSTISGNTAQKLCRKVRKPPAEL